MSARATSADVARRAGVSRATVSYVLNDRPGHSISAATREKVRAAADELGYIPNHSARALRGKLPPVILVVTREVPFGRNAGDMMDTFAELAAQHGFSLVSLRSGNPLSLETTVVHLRPRLVITTLPVGEEDLQLLSRLHAPVVDGWGAHLRTIGGGQAARMQVERLLAAGRRRLAHLGATEENLQVFQQERRAGVEAACAEAGLPAPLQAAMPMMTRPEELAPLREVLRRWRGLPEPVDAVACYNDFWAAALLQAARAEGVAVPGELSVIGLDDEPMAAFLEPPLTTIDYDASGLARALFAQGLELIGEEAVGFDEAPSAPFHVIERGSV